MIFIIQPLLIVAAVIFAGIVLGNRHTYSGRAWKKIALLALSIMMIVAVAFPTLTDDVAKLVGVGRGADLVLYMTVVSLIFHVLNDYLHRQDQREILYRLAQKIALMDAKSRYDIND